MPKHFIKIRKSNCVIIAILVIVYFGNVMFTTFNGFPDIKNNAERKFAGSAACRACHKSIYDSHIKTAHYLDSRPVGKEFIKGSFETGKNKFVYNKWMEVVMESRKNGFFQTAYISGTEFRSERFDMVIGSGRKGQTYLYWNENHLFQLPVSYYTPLDSWCNSPGFSGNIINFDRIIPAECLECHGTYAKAGLDNDKLPVYDRSQLIYGIDCERCHGPAADHVAFYTAHPEDKSAKYIISTKLLSRQQKLDGCALCHSGFRKAIQPPFSFAVGDTLDKFSHPMYNADSVSTLDVHGNQYGLLTASKCFSMSHQMDCSSCHNVHVNEVNNPKLFSQRCIDCHSKVNHTSIAPAINKGFKFNENCIDCHMPMLSSQKIILSVSNAGKSVPDVVRTHRIAIYPEKTKEFLARINDPK